ncbi:hypothetical protein MKW98_009727 [Papaver atlanticum]|uniref:Non-specific lipid-transfer protein n=1 Tax=Papaver atlanticum TaxID=357466 RepID=A0AAD4XLF9_9MAGN|nr:hypothetical protein MKW98_009727 [Papaver atlanticum]
MAALFKLAYVVLAFLVVVAPYAAEGAIPCSMVFGKLSPCLGYLAGGPLNPLCCPGLRGLVSMGKTTHDRQTVCNCLKISAKGSNIKPGKAASLLRKCGVSIPYKISPDADCATVCHRVGLRI